MDPITAFATIVGLLYNFRQEKGAQAALDHRAFMEWLDYHRHEQLKEFIANTAAVRGEVDNLLRAEHGQMLAKLDQIGKVLATLLSRFDEFRGLTAALVPDAELSEQAGSMLRQFVTSGAKDCLVVKDMRTGATLHLMGGRGGQIQITEPRYLEDDFDTLVQLGLLSLKSNRSGDPVCGITRNAARYVEAIDRKSV